MIKGSSSHVVSQAPASRPNVGQVSTAGDDDRGVSFYTDAPDVELSLREFEELCCERLKVLHAFDRACGYEVTLSRISEVSSKFSKEIYSAQLDLPRPAPGKQDAYPAAKAEFQRRDSISHFVLRFAFCKTRDAREWFLKQEQRLFLYRFNELDLTAQEAFMKDAGMPCKRFDEKEWDGFSLKQIQDCTIPNFITDGSGQKRAETEQVFYEMPFTDVAPTLIAARKVVLKQGKAFVPRSQLPVILAGRFRERLQVGMDRAFQGLDSVLMDPRVGGFIRVLQDHGMQMLVAPKSNSDDLGEKLSLDNFDELLVRSFPPCMRRMVESQRERKKHLKHAGRLQLRPFLKECGFNIEESMRWWRQEITKDNEVDVTSFEKNYVYDIEHTYGKKGHFQGQNSFGCPKIIGFPSETAGQCHGCVFKLEMSALKQQLHKWKVPEATTVEIEKLISHGHHYQLACIEYFKAGHLRHEGDGVGNSPGDFFKESCKHYAKKKEKEAGVSPNKTQANENATSPSQAAKA
jgi:DNA primase large subunit